MKREDVITVEQLAEFMDEEATREGRTESEIAAVNGTGIRKQWANHKNCPCAIFYLIRSEPIDDRGRFEMKLMWFDEDGNVTERPEIADPIVS